MDYLLIFFLEQQPFGFDLTAVERIIWAVEVTPFPQSSPHLLGMINLHGEIVPVINLRHLFALKEKEIEVEDQFIICRIGQKTMALWVDHVKGITSMVENKLSKPHINLTNFNKIDYVMKQEDKIVLIFEIEKLLSVDNSSHTMVLP